MATLRHGVDLSRSEGRRELEPDGVPKERHELGEEGVAPRQSGRTGCSELGNEYGTVSMGLKGRQPVRARHNSLPALG